MKYVCAALVLLAGFMIFTSQGEAASMAIKNGSKVTFDYTLTVDGKVVDTSDGKAPLEYTQGDGKLIPGLTKQMEGMKAGDEKTITVKPEEAYGNSDPKAFKEYPLSMLPKEMKPQVGMILQGSDAQGRTFPSRIAEVKKDTVVMDFNHPLAGKTLSFKVKIVSVK